MTKICKSAKRKYKNKNITKKSTSTNLIGGAITPPNPSITYHVSIRKIDNNPDNISEIEHDPDNISEIIDTLEDNTNTIDSAKINDNPEMIKIIRALFTTITEIISKMNSTATPKIYNIIAALQNLLNINHDIIFYNVKTALLMYREWYRTNNTLYKQYLDELRILYDKKDYSIKTQSRNNTTKNITKINEEIIGNLLHEININLYNLVRPFYNYKHGIVN